MATYVNGTSSNKYVQVRLAYEVSGSTITAWAEYRRTSGQYNYYDPSFPVPTMTIAGTTYKDNDFYNRQKAYPGIALGTSWISTTKFSKTVTSTNSYSITWKAGTSYAVPWATSITATTTVTAGSPPSNLSLTITNATWNSVTANTVVGNWGTGNSNYRELKVLNANFAASTPAYQSSNSSTSTGAVSMTTSTSSTKYNNPTFSFVGCTLLHTGLYAKTSAGEALYNGPTFYTAPYKLSNLTAGSATAQADGTYNVQINAITSTTNNNSSNHILIQYRLSTNNGSSYGSWLSVSGSVSVGATKSFTITGLQPNLKCIVQVRQSCAEASQVFYSETSSVSFSTPSVTKPTLTYSWNDVRDTLTVKATVDLTANAGIEIFWGYNSNVSSSLTTTSAGSTTATGTIKYPNHGSGQVIYLMARVYIGSKSNYLETSKVSLPVPNPILGVATTTSGKQYIVDIVEKKADGSITPKWQNGQRIVKK